MHACCEEQSLLETHSGLQLGADPMNPVKQEHDGLPPAETWHCEFGPHGEGTQGSTGAAGDVGTGSTAMDKQNDI